MLRGREINLAALGLAALAPMLWAFPAAAQVDGEHTTPGSSCSGLMANSNAADWDTIMECSSNTWARGPYFLGSTSDSCDSNHAGMVQWTGSSVAPNNTFEFCNGTSWISVSGNAALSSITAATASASINSAANAITWAWNSIASGTALSLTSTDMTSGTILEIENTYGGNSTGNMVYLQDVTTGAGTALYVLTTGSGNTGYAGYFINSATSGANYGVYGSNASTSGYGGYFTNTSTGLALYASGIVGIGTAVVDSNYLPLMVNSVSGDDSTIALSRTTTTIRNYVTFYSPQALVATWPEWYVGTAASDPGFQINGWNGSSTIGPLYISTTGSVGISTATPSSPLMVSVDSGSVPSIELGTTADANNYLSISGGRAMFGYATGNALILNAGTGKGIYMYVNGTTNSFQSGTQAVVITTTGSVGIGTASPAQKLEVNGEVKVDTFASAAGTTVCENGNVLSSCSSSIRYKENVRDAPFGLKEVMEMRPVIFKWKDRDENDFGLVAEDVEKINPLFVTYKNGQIEGVKYPQLSAILVNAMQEQQAQIEKQAAALRALQQEIATLKAQDTQQH